MADKIKGTFKDEQGNEFYPHCYSEATGGSTQAVINKVYPVGAVYISVNSTNPSTLFGGTWEQINGRFLLGCGVPTDNTVTGFGSDLTADGTNKYNMTAKSTGGASRHLHSTAAHTLTIEEMPSHDHGLSGGGEHKHTFTGWLQTNTNASTTYQSISHKRIADDGANTPPSMNSTGTHSHTVDKRGSGNGHSHGNTGNGFTMPPFFAVYMWYRTA